MKKQTFSKKLYKYAVVSTIGFGMVAGVAVAENIKFLTSWGANSITYKANLSVFLDYAKKHSNGDINFDVIGTDAIGALEQLEPAQLGIVDMLFSHPAYHAGTSKVGVVADAIQVNPKSWRANGIFDAFDKHYNTMGLKVIGIIPQGKKGFVFAVNQAVDGRKHSLEGMKVRANASYVGVIEKLGGTPVPLGGGQIYSSLQSGVIDAAPWSAIGLIDFKIYEVASHMLQPNFGSLSLWMWMNLDKWNDLDSATKDAINKAAMDTEMYGYNEISAMADKELEDLQKKGMKLTYMNEHEQKNVADWMAASLWELGNADKSETVAKIRTLAQKAGLAK